MLANKLLYDACGYNLTNLIENPESAEYGACSFELNEHKVQYRISKITPTKTGQFVTIWKRNEAGITAPFDFADEVDFIIISSRNGADFGQFIFPKIVLVEKGILSRNGEDGKRGIRVYPPWDLVASKQAEKTQAWQTKFFVKITEDKSTDLKIESELFKNILEMK